MNYQVEHVARAFYDASGEDQLWDHASDTLKDEFRLYARDAIALLRQHHDKRLVEAFYSVATITEPVALSDAA